nr:response regulator [Tissierella sp.]
MIKKRFRISRKLFAGFAIVTLLMLSVILYSYSSFIQQDKILQQNLKTYNIISYTDDILQNMLNMETGVRGYALTGNEKFLAPYYIGKLDYEKSFDKVKNLTMEDEVQQEHLVELDLNKKLWLDYVNLNFIDAREDVNLGKVDLNDYISVVKQGNGKKYMDIIRDIIYDIKNQEEKTLYDRSILFNKLKTKTFLIMSVGGLIATILSIIITMVIARLIVKPINSVTKTFDQLSMGDADYRTRLAFKSNDELGQLAKNFNKFMDKIEKIIIENLNESWIKTGQTDLNEKLRNAKNVEELTGNAIDYIVKYTDSQIGAIYTCTDNSTLKLLSSYAYENKAKESDEIKFGEGVIGQAALDKQTIFLKNIPDDYINISTGVGQALPKNIIVTPGIYSEDIKCIIEIGSFNEFTQLHIEFIERVSEGLAVAIGSVESRIKMQEMLETTLEQSEELKNRQIELSHSNEYLEKQTIELKQSEEILQAQQEELRQSNEELEEQSKSLMNSESQLQTQQEELRVTNEELQERTKSLEIQKNDIADKNETLRKAKLEIEEKVKAIELESKYKSEFFANMSHELRTPLNSILVLSQIISEREVNSLITTKHLEYANTIHSSGENLLGLINDVLDLSKLEAGKIDIVLEPVNLSDLLDYTESSFMHIAEKNNVYLKFDIDEELPETIISDEGKIHQILNNLLSNAFKFTHEGGVTVSIHRPKSDEKSICISIKDTGIGILEETQSVIFDAFKQSDGTISRKYGGTGLGLSISKGLANNLGGDILLQSEEGKGSTFTLVLPQNSEGEKSDFEEIIDTLEIDKLESSEVRLKDHALVNTSINDDRQNIKESDKVVLIIEDDHNFSRILNDIAHEKGYKSIIAQDAKSGIQLANRFLPDAILIDIGLPDMNGWKVVEHLEKNSNTKSIPIHVISGKNNKDDEYMEKYKNSVVEYINKPVGLDELNKVFSGIEGFTSKKLKKLLVLDESGQDNKNIRDLLGYKDIQISFLASGEDALEAIKEEVYDCIVLDLNLKDMTGLQFLQSLSQNQISNIPIIVYTEDILEQEDEIKLKEYAESIIIKGSRSSERLIAEVNLFLHHIDKLNKSEIKSIKSVHEKENSLKDKKIIIVDDDMRNVFALSNLLEDKGMKVIVGRNGKEGIEKLKENTDADLILMDIMMPVMDGYTAMSEIRNEPGFSEIPIIALTAKSMKDDREKSIAAGANDYLTKPIDTEKLISLLRVWLYK